jgi:hypothetical protein
MTDPNEMRIACLIPTPPVAHGDASQHGSASRLLGVTCLSGKVLGKLITAPTGDGAVIGALAARRQTGGGTQPV